MSNDFKTYKRKGQVEARIATADDYLDPQISVSQPDREAGFRGGMVARNPDNHADQWFIAQAFFEKNYEQGAT